MGLWNLLTGLRRTKSPTSRPGKVLAKEDRIRRCRFEAMEERRMMDADPIKLGGVYIEEDGGSDLHGDTFEIKYEGGAAGTQLTRLTINTDQGIAGRSVGDLFFDTVKGGWGADEAFGMQIVSKTGIDSVTWHVEDGGTLLVFEFVGFNAGEKLVFSIDVDEVQDFDPAVTDINLINEGVDPITSGVEFQGSILSGSFTAPHYFDVSGQGEFRNSYDNLFAGSNLLISASNPNGLPSDNHNGKRDRSTGTMFSVQQQPKPISIEGTVFFDADRDLIQDAGDNGIQGVALSLWKKVGNTYVATGHTTQTDAQGNYKFGLNLNLTPGTYQIRETQPPVLKSVGAIPGTVSGTSTGSTVAGDPDILTEINIPLGDTYGINYDFAETLPASIRGRVHLTDDEGNCFSEEALSRPLANVKVVLKDGSGTVVGTTFTNQNGEYEFLDLLPGVYTIIEETPIGLIDGGDHIGTIDGVKVGTKGGNDILTQITLGAGDDGVNYDFCEHEPSLVSGHVYHDRNNNGIRETGEEFIAGTTVVLLDGSGTQIGSQVTDVNGFYKFTGLGAGTYSIVEVQPSGWIDGKDAPGTVDGVAVGSAVNPGDRLNSVVLKWGSEGINYDFGELKPGAIMGRVFYSPNGDCEWNAGDTPLSGVKVELLDVNGNVVATTFTNNEGLYRFDNLPPGVYAVKEHQPEGYLQGGTKPGSHGGNGDVQDLITAIPISSGDQLTDYNFCEKKPVSIEGLVYVDLIQNCVRDPSEPILAGVTIELIGVNGNVLATTTTNAQGRYKFDNLTPGTYTVRETQPAGYFHGCQKVGSHGGDDSVDDVVSNVTLTSGQAAVEYNFGEIPPASLSGYVFRDGAPILSANGQLPDNLYQIRDGVLTADDLRLKGVLLELRHTLTGEPVMGSEVMPGHYGNGPLRVTTNANGYYEFKGLPAGNYTVIQVQPDGYYDSIDTPGSTSGLAVNRNSVVSPLVIQRFAAQGVSLNNDAILQIPLAAGQNSTVNNFSEVQVTTFIIPIPPEELLIPPPPPELVIPPPFLPIDPPQVFIPPPVPNIITGGDSNFTWHLSIIDAGLPRFNGRGTQMHSTTFRPAMFVDGTRWESEKLRDGIWTIHAGSDTVESPNFAFGIPGSIPVVGDWNGDGRADLGLFFKGEWFLDLNGNGKWDEGDLWAKLGSEADLPVVGDWDGDGKDDIGIFGPEWPGDPRHIENEPGLPDPDNVPKTKTKNVPPDEDEATDGVRLLRLTARGNERSDLIDHVFQFGSATDKPIAGDWNGDGIPSIGIFREGKWHFDMDGDGRWSTGDRTAQFGEKGDLPVIGDFNGDGIDEIGVYRAGKWIVDTNGNREIDASDRVFELGGASDLPVVGDFDGDGTDDPSLYREQAAPQEARVGSGSGLK
jgi:serine-aspartate repeat-containing protein C/D/E